MNPSWEFFYVPLGSGRGGWGWRKRIEGTVTEASVTYFPTFFECHQDAKMNGFAGEVTFTAPNTAFGALPAASIDNNRLSEKKH